MRASFEALRRRISLSAKANSKQRRLLAGGILAVAVAVIIAVGLEQAAQPDREMPAVADKAVAGKYAPSLVPSFGSNFTTDNSVDITPDEPARGNAELRAAFEALASRAATENASNDKMPTGPKEAAVVHQEIAAPIREIVPPVALNAFGDPARDASNFDGGANRAGERQTAPAPVSAGERAKQIAAMRRAKLIEDRQEWRYCLAPSYAEGKVYLSPPIASSALSERAEAVFERTLKKDDIAHDVVQCPRASNRPTLVFRQRYAVRWNEDNGNTVVTLEWRGGVEPANKDQTSSRPLVASSTALPIR
jgi:hypothetical protein